MSAPRRSQAGFTLAELLAALALMALVLGAAAAGLYSADMSHGYASTKAEMLTRLRGVLDRMARDIYRAEATLVSDDRTAVNVLVEVPGTGTTVWRQYRLSTESDGQVIRLYEDTAPLPFPPDVPGSGATSVILTHDVSAFEVTSLLTSTRSVTETLACRITATCGPNAGNQFTVPMKEGEYVLKLSQTQYDDLKAIGQLEECVDVDPRPEYIEDDNPNVYWLCLEDAKAPPVALTPGDWDFNDFMLKVTETGETVEMEVHWGTAAYDRDVMGPDGELLYGDIGGTHTYTYAPQCSDSDTVKIRIELCRDNQTVGTTVTATQRKAFF